MRPVLFNLLFMESPASRSAGQNIGSWMHAWLACKVGEVAVVQFSLLSQGPTRRFSIPWRAMAACRDRLVDACTQRTKTICACLGVNQFGERSANADACEGSHGAIAVKALSRKGLTIVAPPS